MIFLPTTPAAFPVAAPPTTHQVLEVLQTSPDLVTLLRGAESAYAAYITSRARRLDGQFGELLPWLCEQLVEWEVGATANFLGESPASVPQLLLFGVSEEGMACKVRDLLTEAESVCKVRGRVNHTHTCVKGYNAQAELVAAVREAAAAVLPMAQLPAAVAAAAPTPEAQDVRVRMPVNVNARCVHVVPTGLAQVHVGAGSVQGRPHAVAADIVRGPAVGACAGAAE